MSQEIIEAIKNKDVLKDASWEEVEEMGRFLKGTKDLAQWYLGMLGAQISTKYGENSVKKIADAIGITETSLRQYIYVVKRYKEDRELSYLPYTAYRYAAGTNEPDNWIDRAEKNNWTAEIMWREIKRERDGEKIEPPIKPKIDLCSHCNKWIVRIDDDYEQICEDNIEHAKLAEINN